MKAKKLPFGRRLKAAFKAMAGKPLSLTDPEGWVVPSASGPAGVTVNPSTVLQVSAAWACVRLIAETVASLPLSLYERSGDGGKRVAAGHPLHFILHDQPNPDCTASVLWESSTAAMLLRGNARCEKLKVADRTVGLRFLNPDRLFISKGANGQKTYRYTEKNGRQREIPRDRIWTVPGFSLDGEEGVSVISYGAKIFGAALAADQQARRTFSNGMLQTVYYKVASWLQPKQREEFKKNIRGAVERGEAPLLEGNTDVQTIGISPKDAQLLESRAFSVEEICRWFRVDPALVGHGQKDSNWGTGLEQKMIWFLMFTLRPWLTRIEQAISKDLLTPAERLRYYPKFNVEGLLRADSKARASFYGVMVDKGILTRDEVRALEDRAPMGGNAAKLTVQSAMTTLDSLGAGSTPSDDLRNALRNLLGMDDAPAPPAD